MAFAQSLTPAPVGRAGNQELAQQRYQEHYVEKALDSILGPQARTIALRARRANVLAANIANADTPHYLARDVDFKAALHEARGSAPLRTTDARHLASARSAREGLAYRIPQQPSADGNTVDIHGEKARFTENALGYMTDLSFLDGRIKKLVRAFRGD